MRWLSLLGVCPSCECARLPRIFNLERHPNRLKGRLKEVDIKPAERVKLCECRRCGQHWQVDEWDRYPAICALRIDDPAGWQSFDDRPDRMRLLLESRGGLSEEGCAKARCPNRALKSLAYCPAHAYELGIRD